MIKIILVLILSFNLSNLFAQQAPSNPVNVAAAAPAQAPAQAQAQSGPSTGLTKVFADQSEAANQFLAKEIEKNKKIFGKQKK